MCLLQQINFEHSGSVIFDLIQIWSLRFSCVFCFDFLYFLLCDFYLDHQGLPLTSSILKKCLTQIKTLHTRRRNHNNISHQIF